MRLAQQTVAEMREDAALVANDKSRKAAEGWARRSGDYPRLKAMVKIAASDTRIATTSSEFDYIAGLLPVRNGVVHLASGRLLPHDPARLTTSLAPAEYVAGAHAPRFQAFLDRVLPCRDVQVFLQRYLGHAICGQRRERLFGVMRGRGANGKSAFAEIIIGVLGPFVFSTPSATFLKRDRGEDGHRSDLVGLKGSRVVFGMEVPDRRKLDPALIKRLSGDSTFTARTLYKVEQSIPVTFGCLLQSNPWPGADECDDALWDRLFAIPFSVVIPREEQISGLADLVVAEEARGVLAWLVEGAAGYLESGLTLPPAVVAATAEWRSRVSTVPRFVAEHCQRVEGATARLSTLQENFRDRLASLGIAVTEVDGIEVVNGVTGKHL